jgi:hypothetical protein
MRFEWDVTQTQIYIVCTHDENRHRHIEIRIVRQLTRESTETRITHKDDQHDKANQAEPHSLITE